MQEMLIFTAQNFAR